MGRLGRIEANGDTTNSHLAKLNGSVAKLTDVSQIHTIAIARIDERNEGIDKAADRKILTTQNIIAAAAVLIAIVTYIYK